MWQKVIDSRLLQYNTPLKLDHLFRSSVLRINAALDKNAAFPFGKRTYKYVALLFPIFYDPETGLTKAQPRKLYLGNQEIQFVNPYSYSYNLEIQIHYWTSQLDLTIWQSDEELNVEQAIKLGRIQSSLDAIGEDVKRVESKIDAGGNLGV
jgi:hypothetical protein